jgi:hypothetical protein
VIAKVGERRGLISNMFEALENFSACKDISGAWDKIKENIKISAKETVDPYEWKQHETRCDEECLQFLGQRNQAKMQWLQDPDQSNLDNLNNATYEASRHFRGKKEGISESQN